MQYYKESVQLNRNNGTHAPDKEPATTVRVRNDRVDATHEVRDGVIHVDQANRNREPMEIDRVWMFNGQQHCAKEWAQTK